MLHSQLMNQHGLQDGKEMAIKDDPSNPEKKSHRIVDVDEKITVEKALSSGETEVTEVSRIKKEQAPMNFDQLVYRKNQSRYGIGHPKGTILWLRTYMINSKLFPIHVLILDI